MNKWQKSLIWFVFILSRIFILAHPPYYRVEIDGKTEFRGYSDVQHDSERYANMWYYGLMPYREHLFEYPPAAIPIMLIPLLVDQAGISYYYLDYRIQIFVLEIVLFTGIFYTVNRLPIKLKQKWLALGFYIGAGVLAKDFWYDGLDLVFIGSLTLALIWRLGHDYRKMTHRVIFWALFWLSVAVKLLTIPLLVPYAWIKRHEWKREILAVVGGALIIWIVPLILFRSSLSVFLFFHGTRPLKYEAFGTFVVLAINDFTHTEEQTQIAPHFPLIGPVTTVVETTLEYLFPLSIIMVMIWGGYIIRKKQLMEPENRLIVFHYFIKISLVYIFTIFLTSKILSRPFHLWYVPLIAIYPFKNWKTQIMFIAGASLMLLLDTTPYLKVPQMMMGVIPLQRVRDLFRFLPVILLLYLSVKLPEPVKNNHKSAQAPI